MIEDYLQQILEDGTVNLYPELLELYSERRNKKGGFRVNLNKLPSQLRAALNKKLKALSI